MLKQEVNKTHSSSLNLLFKLLKKRVPPIYKLHPKFQPIDQNYTLQKSTDLIGPLV